MAHDIGLRLDDALEASEREATRLEGGAEWVTRAAPFVIQAHAAIEAEVESGKMDLEAAQVAKAILSRLGSQLSQLATQATSDMQAARGKVAAFRAAVGLTKQAFDSETAKAKAAAQAEEPLADADASRPVGSRPPPSLKARRKAGARAKNA